MDVVLIGAIIALAGVAVGAFAEAWRSSRAFKRDKAWQLDEEKRRRLEHLYEALEEIVESYALAYAEALDMLGTRQARRWETKQKAPWARLKMLVNLYAPDLTVQLAAFEAAGRVLGSALADGVTQVSIDEVNNTHLAGALETAMSPFAHAADGMRASIIASSQTLAKSAAKAADSQPK